MTHDIDAWDSWEPSAVASRLAGVDVPWYVAGGWGGGEVVPISPAARAAHYQPWAWDPAGERWRFDVFREPHDGDVWISRRDSRLRRPYANLIRIDRDG